MTFEERKEKYKGVEACCETCEFNFDNICGCGDNNHKYGSNIENKKDVCRGWNINYDEYSKLIRRQRAILR